MDALEQAKHAVGLGAGAGDPTVAELWSTIRYYFFLKFLKEPLWSKSLYFFFPGYLKTQVSHILSFPVHTQDHGFELSTCRMHGSP